MFSCPGTSWYSGSPNSTHFRKVDPHDALAGVWCTMIERGTLPSNMFGHSNKRSFKIDARYMQKNASYTPDLFHSYALWTSKQIWSTWIITAHFLSIYSGATIICVTRSAAGEPGLRSQCEPSPCQSITGPDFSEMRRLWQGILTWLNSGMFFWLLVCLVFRQQLAIMSGL